MNAMKSAIMLTTYSRKPALRTEWEDCGKIMNTKLILVVHVPWNEQTQQRPTADGCSSYDWNASASFSSQNRLTDWHMHTELSAQRIKRESPYATLPGFNFESVLNSQDTSSAIIFLSRGNKVKNIIRNEIKAS